MHLDKQKYNEWTEREEKNLCALSELVLINERIGKLIALVES